MPMKNILLTLIIAALFLCSSCSKSKHNVEDNNTVLKQTAVEETTTVKETTTIEEITSKKIELTKKEYKKSCTKLFYDDVFWGDDDLENQDIELEIMLSEKMYFTNDNMYNNSIKTLVNDYSLNKNFFKACVKRKDVESYVGSSITVLFSDDYKVNINDYDIGNKITVYGKVIYWSNNTWDGYNSVYFVPKYIDKN